jgi:hypothetical protein
MILEGVSRRQRLWLWSSTSSGFHSEETRDVWEERLTYPNRDREGAALQPLADARGSVGQDASKCKPL